MNQTDETQTTELTTEKIRSGIHAKIVLALFISFLIVLGIAAFIAFIFNKTG